MSNVRNTIRQLQSDPQIRARCPRCERSFQLHRALLFDAHGPIPSAAIHVVEALKEELTERRASLAAAHERVEVRTEQQSIEGTLARVLEQVAPVLPGFGLNPRDCRQLSNPIDYIAFNGLSERGVVDSLSFIDVKTGEARLAPHQHLIKEAVVAGRVGWLVYKEDIS